jgi:mono/diheme cytochrome c family protein
VRRASLALALLALACNSFRLGFGNHGVKVPLYVTPNPSLVEGDPVAGRQAFIELKCIDCHRVAEDPHLPMGHSALAGPMLANMDKYSANDLAQIIRATKTGAGKEFAGKTMKDYTEPMTTRQLVDVVAYLRNPKLPKS